MRVSTTIFYDQAVNSIQQRQTELMKTQQQVSSGRRISAPSDDPVAAARALDVSQSVAGAKQFLANVDSAKNSLGLEEGVLASITSLIQDVKATTVAAGNPTLNNSDRASLATELRGRYQELLGLANSSDGNGQYLFSGYMSSTAPFAETSPGNVAYSGDDGQRHIQVAAGHYVAVSDSGADVLMRIKNGNGTFVTTAAAGNTGTGAIDQGTVATAYDGNRYQIQFNVGAGTTYDVYRWNTATSAYDIPINVGVAYNSGSAISVGGGGQVVISGAPANGDTFTIDPSANQSLFKTLSDLITVLETPVGSGAGNAAVTNGVATAVQNLDNGLDAVLKVRSAVGSRLKETDAAQGTGESLSVQYQQTLSSLQDLDYADAISRLNQQQMYLEAAQKSFAKVSGLSLFSFL